MAIRCFNLSKILARSGLTRQFPQVTFKRSTTHDYAGKLIGHREVVGYGWSGCPVYCDRVDYPFPAIRFQEETVEICRLREKEKCDWGDLTKDEVKKLYRYSFCQTFAEFKAPTAQWKIALGSGFWAVALTFLYYYLAFDHINVPYPETFSPERKSAQLKRAIALEMNPVDGLASWWDYEKNDWK